MNAKFFTPLALCLGLSFSTWLHSQEPERLRPPHPENAPGHRGGDGERRGDRDRSDRADRLRNLSPEQRQKVRDAFEKVWVRPEVEKAREELRLANETYRKAVEDALKAVDPEAATLLERNRPEPPHYQIPLARVAPASNDAAALESTLNEVQSGLQEIFERTYKRQRHLGEVPQAQDVHAKILAAAPVQASLEAFKKGDAESSKVLWETFRKAYLDELIQHLPARNPNGRPEGPPPHHGRGDRPGPPPSKAPENFEKEPPAEAAPAPAEKL